MRICTRARADAPCWDERPAIDEVETLISCSPPSVDCSLNLRTDELRRDCRRACARSALPPGKCRRHHDDRNARLRPSDAIDQRTIRRREVGMAADVPLPSTHHQGDQISL